MEYNIIRINFSPPQYFSGKSGPNFRLLRKFQVPFDIASFRVSVGYIVTHIHNVVSYKMLLTYGVCYSSGDPQK